MTKDKTVMQELLEWVRKTLPMDLDTPRMIEAKIESLLEKEKEQLIAFGYNQIQEVDLDLDDIIYKKLPEEIYKDTFGNRRTSKENKLK